MDHTIDERAAGRLAQALLHRLREALLALDEVEERVHGSDVPWPRARVFASAFIELRRLEVAIERLRAIDHPMLREAFADTARAITRRLALGGPSRIDDELRQLLADAYALVGPGTR